MASNPVVKVTPDPFFYAVCNGCGKTGPHRTTHENAVESVTAEAASRNLGFRDSSCWEWRCGFLYCGQCKDPGAVRSASADGEGTE